MPKIFRESMNGNQNWNFQRDGGGEVQTEKNPLVRDMDIFGTIQYYVEERLIKFYCP